MAGLPGNVAWVAIGKQSAKGTPATAPKFMYALAGGNVQPVATIERLSETDSSRDVGVAFKSQQRVEGTIDIYVRDANASLPFAGAFGAVVDSGSTNFVHTITPATALPYYTVWVMKGNLLWERFDDVLFDSITVKAQAGGAMTASLKLLGRAATRLTADPSPGWTGPPVVALDNSVPITFNDATITLSGGATALISSFEFELANNLTGQQTDDIQLYDIAVGTREVNVSFDLIFETLVEYNSFFYGGAAGTAPVSTIYTTSCDFDFIKGANNGVKVTVPSLSYEEFPVEPQPDGSPLVVSVRGQANRGASPVATVVVKNQIALAQ